MPEHDGSDKYTPDEKGDPRKYEPEMVELSAAGPERPWFWYTVMFLIFCLTMNNIVKMILANG